MNPKLFALLVVLIGLAVGALAIWQFVECTLYHDFFMGCRKIGGG
jgi:hypothetical protein